MALFIFIGACGLTAFAAGGLVSMFAQRLTLSTLTVSSPTALLVDVATPKTQAIPTSVLTPMTSLDTETSLITPNPGQNSPSPTPTSTILPTATSSDIPTIIPTASPTKVSFGQIVFTCFDGTDDEICLMSPDGTGRTRLTDNDMGDFYPSVSPNGRQIVYAHQINGSNYEIFSMRTDGSEATQLTRNGAGNFAPEYSPDGTAIAYTSTQGGNGQQIYVMQADGSNSRALTQQGENVDPTWSPDGRYIAYSSTQSGSRQIWVMNANGSNPRQITGMADVGGRSSWAFDGKTLAFYAGKRANLSRRVYLVDVNGGDPRLLPFDSECLGPSFSPDGQWIAFTSARDGKSEIYIMRIDGTGLSKLSANAISDYQPRWGR
jgi:TolB protein